MIFSLLKDLSAVAVITGILAKIRNIISKLGYTSRTPTAWVDFKESKGLYSSASFSTHQGQKFWEIR